MSPYCLGSKSWSSLFQLWHIIPDIFHSLGLYYLCYFSVSFLLTVPMRKSRPAVWTLDASPSSLTVDLALFSQLPHRQRPPPHTQTGEQGLSELHHDQSLRFHSSPMIRFMTCSISLALQSFPYFTAPRAYNHESHEFILSTYSWPLWPDQNLLASKDKVPVHLPPHFNTILEMKCTKCCRLSFLFSSKNKKKLLDFHSVLWKRLSNLGISH